MLMMEDLQRSIDRIGAISITEFYPDGQQLIDRVKILTEKVL
jgi:hypothetical protein